MSGPLPCSVHPEAPSKGQCRRCGQEFCDKCLSSQLGVALCQGCIRARRLRRVKILAVVTLMVGAPAALAAWVLAERMTSHGKPAPSARGRSASMGDGHQERILRAKHMRRTGRPDQARAELGLVLKDEPDHVGALHCLARLDREAGAWEAVLKNTGRILERHPAAVEARSWNAEALLSLGQAGRAESSLRKGLAASPRSGVLGLALARLLAASGRRPQALELLRELIKRGPDGEVDALHALLQELEQPPR